MPGERTDAAGGLRQARAGLFQRSADLIPAAQRGGALQRFHRKLHLPTLQLNQPEGIGRGPILGTRLAQLLQLRDQVGVGGSTRPPKHKPTIMGNLRLPRVSLPGLLQQLGRFLLFAQVQK